MKYRQKEEVRFVDEDSNATSDINMLSGVDKALKVLVVPDDLTLDMAMSTMMKYFDPIYGINYDNFKRGILGKITNIFQNIMIYLAYFSKVL